MSVPARKGISTGFLNSVKVFKLSRAAKICKIPLEFIGSRGMSIDIWKEKDDNRE